MYPTQQAKNAKQPTWQLKQAEAAAGHAAEWYTQQLYKAVKRLCMHSGAPGSSHTNLRLATLIPALAAAWRRPACTSAAPPPATPPPQRRSL